MGRRSKLVDEHTVRVGVANKSELKVACRYCRENGTETHFVSRTDAVNRHLKVCPFYEGDIPTITFQPRHLVLEQQQQQQLQRQEELRQQGGGRRASGGGDKSAGTKRTHDGTTKPGAAWVTNMERQVLRMLVSFNKTFDWVENKNFRELITAICPQIQNFPELLPRKEDMQRIYKEADEALKEEIDKELMVCKRVMVTVDEWMNSKELYTLAFVVQTPGSRLVAWEWNNPVNQQMNITELVTNEHLADKVLGVVVTRAAAAHMQAVKLPPQILLLSCYHEELVYMVGDCLSRQDGMNAAIQKVNKIAQFLEPSHRAEVLQQNMQRRGRDVRKMAGKVTTQNWLSSSETLSVLKKYWVEVQDTLQWFEEYDTEAADRQLAAEFKLATQSEVFQEEVDMAANVLKAMGDYQLKMAGDEPGCSRLRMILPTALDIYKAVDKSNISNSEEIKQVLNTRMQTWDMDLLILATCFDPLIKRNIFNKEVVPTEFLLNVFESLYQRLCGDDTDAAAEAEASFLQYLDSAKWPFDDKDLSNRSLVSFYWPNLVSISHKKLADFGLRLESCLVSPVDTDKLFEDMGCMHQALKSSKKVTIDDATDPAFRTGSENRRDVRDESDLTTLLDICSHETTFNTVSSSTNEFKFETLFAELSDIGAAFLHT